MQISLADFGGDRAWFCAYRGDQLMLIDSFSVLGGKIITDSYQEYNPGLYHLYLEDPGQIQMHEHEAPGLDLVLDHENIRLETSMEDLTGKMVVFESISNKAFYRFLKMNRLYRSRLGNLLELMGMYNSTDDFKSRLAEEIVRLQKAYNDSILVISQLKSKSLISGLITFMFEPVYNPSTGEDFQSFMKENYFNELNLNNASLLNSPFLTQKIITYLNFYISPGSSFSEQENAFITAVDKIMKETQYDQEVYDFVLNYLIDVFEKFQAETVLIHIADNYLSGECETDNEKIMRDRLALYRGMTVGSRVKDINLLDINDHPKRLSDLQNEYVLIVFWASWCQHCQKFIPRLNEWYLNEGQKLGIGMYMISIDTSKADWEEFVYINEISGTNVLDPEGWEGKVARQYNLYATPSLFLINNDREILAKPVTIRDLRKAITGLEQQ